MFQVLKGQCYEGKRDRDVDSVKTSTESRNFHKFLEKQAELAVRGDNAAQKRLFEAETDMDNKDWEKRSSLHESQREVRSQRLRLRQSNQCADQAQRERQRNVACVEN